MASFGILGLRAVGGFEELAEDVAFCCAAFSARTPPLLLEKVCSVDRELRYGDSERLDDGVAGKP